MTTTPLLFMPHLHKELRPAFLSLSILQFWPGLPNPPASHYLSDKLPLEPQESLYFLENMHAATLAALERLPMHSLLANEQQDHNLEILHEELALAAFANEKKAEAYEELRMSKARQAAQKALLHFWLLEERRLEAATLEDSYLTASKSFSNALGIELDEEDRAALQLATDMTELGESNKSCAMWRFVLENTALFLPEETVFFFSDPEILEEVRENLNFTPVAPEHYFFDDASKMQDCKLEQAKASLYQFFGMQLPAARRPWLERVFCYVLLEAK